MKQYQEVNIVICQLEQQDIITESGGINFLEWLKIPQTFAVRGWDPCDGEVWE